MVDLDFTKLKIPAKIHDNLTVTDISSGAFPRYIEVRMPGADGALRTAIWDGSLNLAVDDVIICHEYPGSAVLRVVSVGGGDSGTGRVRVSDVWESDFGAVALAADADGNLTLNGTRTLTIPTDLIHAGDTDTKMSFTDDDIEFTVGSLSMLKLTETTQDLITLGPGSGDVDINFNGDMFLQGSDGRFGIGTATPGGFGANPGTACHVLSSGDTYPCFRMERSGGSSLTDRAWGFGLASGGQYVIQDITAPANRFIIDLSGRLAIGPGHVPEGSFHVYNDTNFAGHMMTSALNVTGTAVELLANGARDVKYLMSYQTVARDSGGGTQAASGSLAPGAEAEIYNDATDIFKIRVNADGSIDVRRTAGASTLSRFAAILIWV